MQDEAKELPELSRRVCDAAFVVLSYLVGMRVSEILGLEAGCIRKRQSLSGDETFSFISGRIYKTALTAEGTPHEWIAPPIAERAIKRLEEISRPQREQTGNNNLWQYTAYPAVIPSNGNISTVTTEVMRVRLNEKFRHFIGLPEHNGEPWPLSSHQGRKTFAYFVAKKDRTGLYALREHLGHHSILMTDRSYSGHDHEMSKLIGEAAVDEMVHSFAEALTATELAGQAGEHLLKSSPFRGELITEDLLEYTRQRLKETGVHFEVCDYGYCYYNVRHSACHGDEDGPNQALRTQSVCVGCKNFVVTPRHLPVWQERRSRYKAVLEQTDMSTAATTATRAKVAECTEIIEQLKSRETMH